MKILKFDNNYYKQVEPSNVSIQDEIVEIKKKEIPVPTKTFLQELLQGLSTILILCLLIRISGFVLALVYSS